MRFLVDRCAGRRLATWLSEQGHDVGHIIGSDPGDAALLQIAARETRILVTIDTDFGALVYVGGAAHAGIIRMPDVPADRRIELMRQILSDHTEAEIDGAMITVTGQPHQVFAAARLSVALRGCRLSRTRKNGANSARTAS